MTDRLTLDDQATYRICIQGTLGARWADYLGGLDISVSQLDPPLTTVSGHLIDQSAFMCVLNSLYDLGYPSLSVEYKSSP